MTTKNIFNQAKMQCAKDFMISVPFLSPCKEYYSSESFRGNLIHVLELVIPMPYLITNMNI